MAEAKFTSGPWAVSSRGLENDGSAIVVTKATLPDEYHTRIAAVAVRDPGAPRKNRHTYECAERDANARLIAAAPELYIALALAEQALRAVLRNRPQTESAPTNIALDTIAARAAAALAKATS